MNLRAFHILFIAVSTALALLLGVWCLRLWSAEDGRLTLLAAVGSFAAAGALVLYGSWFLRKTRQL